MVDLEILFCWGPLIDNERESLVEALHRRVAFVSVRFSHRACPGFIFEGFGDLGTQVPGRGVSILTSVI